MSCPFCCPDLTSAFYNGKLVVGLWDRFPVSEGHALLVPKRHVPDWFAASPAERDELSKAIEWARQEIVARGFAPQGFNVGMNLGEAAGQTVQHLHLHVIPRYRGDCPEPRGGIRYILPARADYWTGLPLTQWRR